MGALTAFLPQTYADLERWAERAARTDFVPKEYHGKPDSIIVAVQLGAELGLHPMQALQSIAVINGKPCIYGDALLALCKASPACEDVIESPEIDQNGTVTAYLCVARRKGKTPVEQRFSIEDAKLARLWGKPGPWAQYPQRMLQMRARGFALRDAFPDVLKGLITREEAEDYPTVTIEGKAEPAPSTKVVKASRTTQPKNSNGGDENEGPPIEPPEEEKKETPKVGPVVYPEQQAGNGNGGKRPSIGAWYASLEEIVRKGDPAECAGLRDREDVQAALASGKIGEDFKIKLYSLLHAAEQVGERR